MSGQEQVPLKRHESVRDLRFPRQVVLRFPKGCTPEMVRAGDFPPDAKMSGWRQEGDGIFWSFEARIKDVRALMFEDAPLPMGGYRVRCEDLPAAIRTALGVALGQRNAREATRARQERLLQRVGELRARHPGEYDSANAAATYLVDHTPSDDRGRVWGYEIDHADPTAREKAIHALAARIRRAEGK